MKTTAIFAELVIGGLQSIVWILLIVATVIDPIPFTWAAKVPSLTILALLAVSYSLGVIFDRLWDKLLDKFGINNLAKKKAIFIVEEKKCTIESKKINDLREMVYKRDATSAIGLAKYSRSRMRVARASMFNFALITIVALVLVTKRIGIVNSTFMLVLVLGTLLCATSALAYWRLSTWEVRVLYTAGGRIKTVEKPNKSIQETP
jgi:hypothetical protein